MTSIDYDATRKLTKKTQYKKHRLQNPKRCNINTAPAPYNLGFQFKYLVKNTDDGYRL